MAPTVRVIVATVSMLLIQACSISSLPNGTTYECQVKQMTAVTVKKPNTTLQLQCPDTLAPAISDTTVKKIYTDSKCKDEELLSTVCPGASGTQSSSGKPINLIITQLPPAPTSFYFNCTDSSTKWCSYAVTVNPAPPEGPQVCAVKGSSVSLSVKGREGSAQFGCGNDLELDPDDERKAYNKNCTDEEKLVDLTRSGKTESYYVLKATNTPKDRTLCYLCGTGKKQGKGPDTCAVLISVSAGTNFAALSAFGLAVPCVLAFVHFT